MSESTEHESERADVYAALIKPGDAVETPDGEPWVVTGVGFGEEPRLELVSACRGADRRIYADAYDATHTSVPADVVTKVADARQVRR
jgi:hypothetical protein